MNTTEAATEETPLLKESRENTTAKPIDIDRSTSLTDKERNASPPFAESEEHEDTGKRTVLNIDHVDSHGADLSDRFGVSGGDGFVPAFNDATGFAPVFNGEININPENIPDVNLYQHKKTVAQGMMDLALFSANANQLRYVLESHNHPYYHPAIVLISFSLICQVVVGVGLLWNTRYDVKDEKEICHANRVNNITVVGIFLVTVINVFILAFGTTAGVPLAPAAAPVPAYAT